MLLTLLTATLMAKPTLYTLDRARLTPAEQVVAQALQGLTGKDGPRVWIETKGVQQEILEGVRKAQPVEKAEGIWPLVDRFRSSIKGVVLYKIGTHSLNVSTSLAGPMSALPIDESQQAEARAHGLSVLLDARDISEKQAFERFGGLFKKGLVMEQSIDKPGHLRDYAILHHAFVMDTDDREFRKRVVREMGPGALVLGWGKDEYEWISDISAAGGSGVAADWCANLSALEALKADHFNLRQPKPLEPQEGVRTIAFVLSDGDNVQWLTGEFVTEAKYYGSPHRGKFPMTWEISPLLANMAPRIMERILERATPNDDFITGPGLPGYMFPHASPERALLAKQTWPQVHVAGLNTLSFLNQNEGDMSEVFPWLDLPVASAAIYKDYSPYNRRKGEIVWHNGKPVVAYRFLLWEGLTGIDDLVRQIAQMPVDSTNQGSYALINVHAWSFNSIGGPIEAVKQTIDRLPADTRVVTANQLLSLIKAAKPR